MPAMVNLDIAQEVSDIGLFQLPVVRAIAAQFIQVVDFLHSRGVVHAGW
jgi:serine/threonine protein kinase